MDEIDITITPDPAAVARMKSDLLNLPRVVERAVDGAIDKTMAKARTMIVRQLSSALTAKRANLASRVSIHAATAGGGELIVMGRRIAAVNFTHRKTAKGIEVRYFKKGGSWNFEGRGTFVGVGAPANNGTGGNAQIFERIKSEPKSRVMNPHYLKNKGKMRQHIGSITGLSLSSVYTQNSHWTKDVKSFMSEDVKTQLMSQADRFLGRSKSERT